MKFSGHKRRRAPSIIIVSLIDVLLVVLIFLMVTTAFKDTPAFKITLPETTQKAPKAGLTENPPFVITITTNAPQFYLGKRAVTFDRLKDELIQQAKANPRHRGHPRRRPGRLRQRGARDRSRPGRPGEGDSQFPQAGHSAGVTAG